MNDWQSSPMDLNQVAKMATSMNQNDFSLMNNAIGYISLLPPSPFSVMPQALSPLPAVCDKFCGILFNASEFRQPACKLPGGGVAQSGVSRIGTAVCTQVNVVSLRCSLRRRAIASLRVHLGNVLVLANRRDRPG